MLKVNISQGMKKVWDCIYKSLVNQERKNYKDSYKSILLQE